MKKGALTNRGITGKPRYSGMVVTPAPKIRPLAIAAMV